MTELEIMERAKMYVDKMANGIDPISDKPVPEGDCLNQVRISRCLFYVSDVLRKLIGQGGNIEKPRKSKRENFSISDEKRAGFRPSASPISLSKFIGRINDLADLYAVKKLKTTAVSNYLLHAGFLAETTLPSGKNSKRPTPQGESIGISLEERTGDYGTYYLTVYNAEAQQFVLDNLDAILEYDAECSAAAAKQSSVWTQSDDEALAGMFRQDLPAEEIAAALKRDVSSVRARLRRLGLIEKRGDAL